MKSINVELLKSIIECSQLSKSAFCKKCGISTNTLNKMLENNTKGLRYTTIRKVCIFTKIGIDILCS